MMQLNELLRELFSDDYEIKHHGDVVAGTGTIDEQDLAIIGTTAHTAIGVETALLLAQHVLTVVRSHPRRPILLLVDTQGQRLSRRDELLGAHGYLAHLSKCLELARKQGHYLVSLVYGEGVSGGFLSFGMMADEVHALPDAQIRVMALPAMARVMKIPLERLQDLSANSPVFAPGVENFLKLGGVDGIWAHRLSNHLRTALKHAHAPGEYEPARTGRHLADNIIKRVREDSA
jgi:malonate decarboxylase gamma subunit